MKEIHKKVISVEDIPEDLYYEYIYESWLGKYPGGCFVEVHIDELEGMDELDKWLSKEYPGIENENSFLLEF